MTRALAAGSAVPRDDPHRPARASGLDCVHHAHTRLQPPLLLATHRAVNAFAALSWLIACSCHIADQLDAEPRRQVRQRMLKPALQDELLHDLQESCFVTIEIADPETLFELTIRSRGVAA
ncbi:hypothetical protein [Streptomyces sp. NBC_00063]|uniref:hypothetical protein n=1 Tax=Streptomyces sp. NBC_00063 TaxID=2975638 RepID=UPI003D72C46B